MDFVSLTCDWECLGKWTVAYECLLQGSSSPKHTRMVGKHNEAALSQPWPSGDKRYVHVPGPERQSQNRLKTNKGNQPSLETRSVPAGLFIVAVIVL